MTHKTHMGAGLENGYNIIGYRQQNHDYSHVEYPGDLRNCDACSTCHGFGKNSSADKVHAR